MRDKRELVPMTSTIVISYRTAAFVEAEGRMATHRMDGPRLGEAPVSAMSILAPRPLPPPRPSLPLPLPLPPALSLPSFAPWPLPGPTCATRGDSDAREAVDQGRNTGMECRRGGGDGRRHPTSASGNPTHEPLAHHPSIQSTPSIRSTPSPDWLGRLCTAPSPCFPAAHAWPRTPHPPSPHPSSRLTPGLPWP